MRNFQDYITSCTPTTEELMGWGPDAAIQARDRLRVLADLFHTQCPNRTPYVISQGVNPNKIELIKWLRNESGLTLGLYDAKKACENLPHTPIELPGLSAAHEKYLTDNGLAVIEWR